MRAANAFVAIVAIFVSQAAIAVPEPKNDPTNSAQIEEPPSASKRQLIREFLKLTGIQDKIDNGSFLEMYAVPGGPLFTKAAANGATFKQAADRSFDALRKAYAPHRPVWQSEYESHVNWEFTEEELTEIVAFLRRPSGQHYLRGRWRMDAYISTNTEEIVEQIVSDAEASLSKKP